MLKTNRLPLKNKRTNKQTNKTKQRKEKKSKILAVRDPIQTAQGINQNSTSQYGP